MILPALHLGRDGSVAAALMLRRCADARRRPRAAVARQLPPLVMVKEKLDAVRRRPRRRGAAALRARSRARRSTDADGLRFAAGRAGCTCGRRAPSRSSGSSPRRPTRRRGRAGACVERARRGVRGLAGCHRRRSSAMCGIVGYVGGQDVRPAPRSTGSSGWSTAATTRPASRSSTATALERHEGGGQDRARSRQLLDERRARPARSASPTPAGPRTARPPTTNAHPHTDAAGRIAVVHNGIIENYARAQEGCSRREGTSSRPRPTPRCSRT